MFNIVRIKGGLGNQMFIYAFSLSLRKKNKAIYLLNIDDSVFVHSQLEIFRIFNCKGKWRYRVLGILHKIKPSFWKKYKYILEQKELSFTPSILFDKNKKVVYDGYWQSEKYFKDIESIVRKRFCFKKKLLNQKNIFLADTISKENSVSIHIRRGDYLNYNLGVCEMDYYQKCISYITERINNPKYYLFSDDIEWCKRHFSNDNFYIVDWNKGNNSWQDMYLMTQCKHNIIANSSFSWWGAWLNNNPDKIVIAPSVWFKDRDNNSCNIVPDEWIKL